MESTETPIPTETFLLPGQQFCVGLPWERAALPKHGLPAAPPKQQPGTTLDQDGEVVDPFAGFEVGPYRVLRRLSVGSAKQLLAVREDALGRAGLYMLRRIDLPDVHAAEIEAYAEYASVAKHAFLSQVHDCVTTDEGVFWVTDFAPGPSVAEVQAECKRQGRGLPMGFALALIHEAAQALGTVHAPGGFAHGLVSDQTVASAFDGTARLLDVGLFRCVARRASWAEVLEPMARYFAPEQLLEGRLPDAKCDVYSLAVVLYECLSGDKPQRAVGFDGRVKQLARGTFVKPSSLNVMLGAALDEVMDKALNADRSKRYASALEFGAALSAATKPFMWRTEQRARFVTELFPTRHRREQELLAEYEQKKASVKSLPALRIVDVPEDAAPAMWALPQPALTFPPLPAVKPGAAAAATPVRVTLPWVVAAVAAAVACAALLHSLSRPPPPAAVLVVTPAMGVVTPPAPAAVEVPAPAVEVAAADELAPLSAEATASDAAPVEEKAAAPKKRVRKRKVEEAPLAPWLTAPSKRRK